MFTSFQISPVAHVDNERLAIVFGFVTLLFGLMAFFSCRTWLYWMGRAGLPNIAKIGWYAAFYKKHIYYWWAFGVSLTAHIMVAIVHTGFPKASDPDAYIHWVILGLGLLSALAAIALFSSCRVLPRLITLATSKKNFNESLYKVFSQYHSYSWGILALLVATHFLAGFKHSGLWPGP